MNNFNVINNVPKFSELQSNSQKLTTLLLVSRTTAKQFNYTLNTNYRKFFYLKTTSTAKALTNAETLLSSSFSATTRKLLPLFTFNCHSCVSAFNKIIYCTCCIVTFVSERFCNKFSKLNSLKRRV